MEITLGVLGPRRAELTRLRGGWRPLRRRRPPARERAGISIDDLLRYRLVEQLTGARRWPWAGADAGRALPEPVLRAPTPDYELVELESEARAAEAAAGRSAAALAGAAVLVLALALLLLLARGLRRCLRQRTKEEPIEEQISPSHSEAPNSDPPPPYSALPAEDKPGEEPPPPYSACYVAFSGPKDEPVYCHNNKRETLLDGPNLVVDLTSEDHRTSQDSIEHSRTRQDSVEYSTRVCEDGLRVEVVT